MRAGRGLHWCPMRARRGFQRARKAVDHPLKHRWVSVPTGPPTEDVARLAFGLLWRRPGAEGSARPDKLILERGRRTGTFVPPATLPAVTSHT